MFGARGGRALWRLLRWSRGGRRWAAVLYYATLWYQGVEVLLCGKVVFELYDITERKTEARNSLVGSPQSFHSTVYASLLLVHHSITRPATVGLGEGTNAVTPSSFFLRNLLFSSSWVGSVA